MNNRRQSQCARNRRYAGPDSEQTARVCVSDDQFGRLVGRALPGLAQPVNAWQARPGRSRHGDIEALRRRSQKMAAAHMPFALIASGKGPGFAGIMMIRH